MGDWPWWERKMGGRGGGMGIVGEMANTKVRIEGKGVEIN